MHITQIASVQFAQTVHIYKVFVVVCTDKQNERDTVRQYIYKDIQQYIHKDSTSLYKRACKRIYKHQRQCSPSMIAAAFRKRPRDAAGHHRKGHNACCYWHQVSDCLPSCLLISQHRQEIGRPIQSYFHEESGKLQLCSHEVMAR